MLRLLIENSLDREVKTMAEWSKATISDFGTTITGKTPSTKNSDYWDGTRMFVTPKDIQSTKHITHTERYISNKGMEAVKGAIIPANSICVSCIGNIGYLGVTMEECITNQQINSIIVSDENSADFVYYYMKYLWPYFKNYEGQSTTLSILNKTQFSKIEVRKPDIDTQIAIASLLSSIDDKIEANEKINNNLPPHLCVARIAAKQRRQTPQTDGCLHTDGKVSVRGDNEETAEQFSSLLAA